MTYQKNGLESTPTDQAQAHLESNQKKAAISTRRRGKSEATFRLYRNKTGIDMTGQPEFYRVNTPTQQTLEALLSRIIQRVIKKLEKEGRLIADPQQPWLDLADPEPIDDISAASIRYRITMGPHSGHRTLTINNPALARPEKGHKPLTANRDGFSLNAAVACQPHQRARLEQLCRYITGPALCLDRLQLREDGQLQYQLKHPFSNGSPGRAVPCALLTAGLHQQTRGPRPETQTSSGALPWRTGTQCQNKKADRSTTIDKSTAT